MLVKIAGCIALYAVLFGEWWLLPWTALLVEIGSGFIMSGASMFLGDE